MGEAAIAVTLVLVIPVAIVIAGGILAALLGMVLNSERKAAHEGSELLELNR